MSDIKEILREQREYFATGATLPVAYRIEQLKRLYDAVRKYEDEIGRALTEDLGKSKLEGFFCETGLVLSEISYMMRHVRRYAREHTVPTPITNFASRSYVKPSPYGCTLIMSPWNYPFLLTVEPLVDAIAAGNTAVVKPSAYSPATSAVIARMLGECFDRRYVAVVTGGRKENSELLEQKFDLIFFTGSQAVGKEVLRHAAEYLMPAVLELGGKSPCIIDSSAKIKLAAKRIVFAKLLNCGQTCVAPDYILCHKSVKDRLVAELGEQIRKQYGKAPLQNPSYGKIINRKHFDRICGLIDKEKTVYGGASDPDTLRIEPTVMDNVTWDDAVMGEEIFGPVIPVLTFDSYDELYRDFAKRPKPLALYLFAEDRQRIKEVTSKVSYGGGCINDAVVHLATSEMGFGGVGESGMGAYHGRTGFDTFSHKKSILDKKTWIDVPLRYQPFKSSLYEKIFHIVLR
ncbi:MAG TPA: aldehyde dehydrogenase family protein [Lachnospiraceae bacterium]|nr:aldehyde dehydrogenase family protein [Lachnospiraceae bacterium]HCR99497.1 aldehyde dehydrogenase family protein [Lachnospiraceae bacterium]